MKKYQTIIATNLSLITIGFFIYVLYIGSSILIPFVLALVVSFLILSIKSFYVSRGFNNIIAYIGAFITIGIVFALIGQIINSNVEEIIERSPEYQDKLTNIAINLSEQYNIDRTGAVEDLVGFIDIRFLLTNTANILTSIVKNAGLILFFTIFILLESNSFWKKVSIIAGEKSTFFSLAEQISEDTKSYFLIKTIVSLGVAFVSFLIMFFFGLDFFIFWAFIIFLFNYIPNVGSIIAVFFPVVFSLIQFESLSLTFLLLLFMVGAQVFFGNFVEPRLMGNKLNLSPLVILLSLIFWGTLWGPIGMLLSVPIMVTINIILAHIEVTRPISILLSEKGIVKFTGMNDEKKLTIKKMKKFLRNK